MDVSVVCNAAQLAPTYPHINLESRPAVPTNQAAYYLHRRPQTLRKWAVYEGTGPVRAFRCNGRLMWPMDEIRAALGTSPAGARA